ncbi:host-nuclease inhibitor [Pseudanabaena phage Pam3]|nr:host-nuclease inhibitor [Pseudanabaena phage Pam3]
MTGYEQLAQVSLGDNILAQIAQTARDILAARREVEDAEEALRVANLRLKTLEEETLVELMRDAGQEKLTTIDGVDIAVKEIVRGQPSQENQPAAFRWLRDGGNGGIIKTQIVAELGKAPPEKINAALKALNELGIPTASAKESVAWQTLGALVREKLAKGEQLPLDILGVHITKKADVKPPKNKG